MKPTTAEEIQASVASEAFVDWYGRYVAKRQAIHETRQQYEDLLVHTIFLAGEYEDLSAKAHAEFDEIDQSFDSLSDFEEQRSRASSSWEELQRREKILEDYRASASEVRARLDARKKATPDALGDVGRMEAELNALSQRVEHAGASVQEFRGRLDADTARRDALWEEVQENWVDAFRANMARVEYAYRARRIRSETEALSGAYTQTNGASGKSDQAIDAELEALNSDLKTLLDECEELFDCVIVEEFIYWAHTVDHEFAFCLPLIDDSDHLNVQVVALQVYEIDRAKGVEFVQPVAEEVDDDDDPRLEAFFLLGRSGARS